MIAFVITAWVLTSVPVGVLVGRMIRGPRPATPSTTTQAPATRRGPST